MTNARDLSNRLADLLRREHDAMADFLVALAEFDRLQAWRELGHTGLFSFLHRELHLSKGAAHFRKVAVELIQEYPEVVEPLRHGRLCITSVVELAKVITPENRAAVLPRFFHCSKREAKEVAAELRPAAAAPHRDVVTAVVGRPPPVRRAAGAILPTPVRLDEPPSIATAPPRDEATATPTATRIDSTEPEEAGRAPVRPDELREPLTADLRRLHVTVSRRFLAKLDAARAALSQPHPEGRAEEILEAALDLLLAAKARNRGLVERPAAKPRPSRDPGHVPSAVKREVWNRARGRCEFTLDSGAVCGSTLRLEYDHVVPRAQGGASTIDNVRLACRGHNVLAARRAFGDAWMDRFTRKRPPAPASSPATVQVPSTPG
jgi:5-methylcytosine-specific restriction endonuclease McrA